jgi:hypothetical protein
VLPDEQRSEHITHRSFSEERITMQYTRQQLFEVLSKVGLHEAADAAVRELPDPADLDQVQEWGMRRGITRDLLISWSGGSP